MATSAELRSGFEYDLEYTSPGMGLDEFESEGERAACAIAGGRDRVEAQRSGLDARAPSQRRHRFETPVGAVALAVAAVAWLAMRQPAATPAPSPPPAPAPAAARSVAALPAVAGGAVAVENQVVARTAAPPPAQPHPSQAAPAPLRAAIGDTLAGVSAAYRRLDAAALGGVWPGADTATLSRQFSSLKYQALSFDACDVRATEPDQAVASCAVSIAAAPKEGDPSLQRRRESWTIVLARQGDRYLMTGVSIH